MSALSEIELHAHGVGAGRETTLILVGGQRLLRAAFAGLLDAQPGVCVASTLPGIESLAEACLIDPPQCDIALIDVDDHRGDCAAAIDRVLVLELDCKLVLLCSEVTNEVASCASTRRIDGVILKESSVGELCDALAHIVTGHAVLPARWHGAPDAVELTRRQLEVLSLISHGYSNDEIADQLGVRPNTIKFHVSEIFRRLGVRNRVEAVAQLGERDLPL